MQNRVYTSLINGLEIESNYLNYTARDGVTLSYQVIGTGQPLLLIHGLGSSSMDWEFQYAALSEKFQLIMPDLRGFGESTSAYFEMTNPSASMQLFVKDMFDLMQHLDIKQAPVIGYSMGGAIALQMAIDHLDNIAGETFTPSSLIIVNSLASFEIDSFKKMYLIGIRKMLTRLFSMQRLAKILGNKLFPENPQLAIEMAKRNGENKKPPYTSALNALLKWQAGPRLVDIEQKTLFISADNDYSPPSEKEKSAIIMKNASVQVIENSMHGTPMDQPEVFNQALLNFLAAN